MSIKKSYYGTTSISLACLFAIIGAIFISGNSFADDSSVSTATISVPVACSLVGITNTAHTAEIPNGVDSRSGGYYPNGIGQTTLKAYCNDSEGFAIYAVGYTDDMEGNTYLRDSVLGQTSDIQTSTTFSGTNSAWAMKMGVTSGTYPSIVAGSSADSEKQSGDPDFSTWQTIPDDYTKVAYRNSATDVNNESIASAEGSSITTTYAAYISTTQKAGTYVGKVKYTLVHPAGLDVIWTLNYNANGGSGAPAAGKGFTTGDSYDFTITNSEPTKSGFIFAGWSESSSATTPDYQAGDTYTATVASPTLYAVWVEDKSISIEFNGNSASAGSMAAINSMYWQEYIDNGIRYGDDVNLPASNYNRAGYGFAGWSTTQLNPNSVNFATDFATLAANDGIYGPSETIHIDGAFLSEADNNDIVMLYAVWVPVARTSGNVELTFQTANLFTTTLSDSTTLSSKSVGYVTALKDVRDNEVYAITKLSDGSWWMIENLRLDLGTANITSSNTNNPKASFLSEIANVSSSDLWCSNYMQPSDATCNNRVLYNTSNLDRALTASPHNVTIDWTDLNAASWYSYGVYYNAYAATAGYGDYDFRGYWDDDADIYVAPSAEGDICPAGWRLPVVKNINSGWDISSYIPGSAYSLWEIFGGDASLSYLDPLDTDDHLSFPYNFIYSGTWNYNRQDNSYNNRGFCGFIWTSAAGYRDPSTNRKDGLEYGSASMDLSEADWYGLSVRCVAVP